MGFFDGLGEGRVKCSHCRNLVTRKGKEIHDKQFKKLGYCPPLEWEKK